MEFLTICIESLTTRCSPRNKNRNSLAKANKEEGDQDQRPVPPTIYFSQKGTSVKKARSFAFHQQFLTVKKVLR